MKLTDYKDIDEYRHTFDQFYLDRKQYPLGQVYDYTHEGKLFFKPAAGTDFHRAAERAIGYAKSCPEYEIFVAKADDELFRVTKEDDVSVVAAAIAGRPVSPDEWVKPLVMCVVEAAEDGDLARVKVLVEELGEDVNKRTDDNLWHALNRAAYHGHTEVCGYLLDKGAKINQPDKFGYTALHLAGMGGREKTAEFLLGHGANAELKDRDNKLPVDLARGNRCTAAVDVLEKHMQALEDERSGVAAQRRRDALEAAVVEHTVLQKGISLSPTIKLGKPKP
ncbi:MAG: ankyrin repeat domain-containing protein [Alphaproteobacteria bacterium]